ncbi:PAS domain S-box-containing protein [Deinobacterium chartae]|uniref:PAS domain S-box-containing protein n=1 Tax=Deinobacterium chartae TaxID=521158 RepID=A0A841HXP1_9DEIO|nr:HD domain-containing phosphohydrolase [Deinobacterium chartae]MBB6096999.1 PAS domain S-box-containing protein [Deinobacterium chartae]
MAHPPTTDFPLRIRGPLEGLEQARRLLEASGFQAETSEVVHLDQHPHALFVLDAAGTILYLNRSWREYSGLEISDCLGRPIRELLSFDPAATPGGGLCENAELHALHGTRRVRVAWRGDGEYMAGSLESIRAPNEEIFRLERQINELNLALEGCLLALLRTLLPSEVDHARRVASFAARLGEALHFGPHELEAVKLGGLLHDIGKTRLPASLLHKHRLNREESRLYHRHPEWGLEVVMDVTFLSEQARQAIYYHHEAYGGGGYPSGVSGEEIPLTARVVAVADAFDNLTGPAPHARMGPREAVSHLVSLAGMLLDPRLVDVFINDVLHLAPTLEEVNALALAYS